MRLSAFFFALGFIVIALPRDTTAQNPSGSKPTSSNSALPGVVEIVADEYLLKRDPSFYLRRDAIVYVVAEGSGHRQAGAKRTELVILEDGTAVIPADHRNREVRLKLTQQYLSDLMKRVDETKFFEIASDRKHFFAAHESSGDWDTCYTWIHVNDGKRKHTIKVRLWLGLWDIASDSFGSSVPSCSECVVGNHSVGLRGRRGEH